MRFFRIYPEFRIFELPENRFLIFRDFCTFRSANLARSGFYRQPVAVLEKQDGCAL
jgi:hypothetical protein